MDITIKCQLSLSKKLRALIQEGEVRVTMVAPSITDGRGEANLVISSDKAMNKSLPDFLGKETSIILVPIDISDVTVEHESVGTIFTKNVPKKATAKPVRTAIDKIATYETPEDGEEGYAIKTEEEIEEETPPPMKITKTPAFRNYIDSLELLDKATKDALGKTSDIDLSKIQDRRKLAEAMEIKEKAEAIDVDAYIVNDKCANLAINDLGINLVLNMPFNLANISAKRIMGSRELKSMFRAGLVKFIRPDEVQKYVAQAERAIEKPTLEVYSSRYEAGDSMENNEGMKMERMDMDLQDLEQPTEEEILLTNLTSRPVIPNRMGGTTKSVHGNGARPQRSVPQSSEANAKGLKTIRRA
jgi:hypothetical protein